MIANTYGNKGPAAIAYSVALQTRNASRTGFLRTATADKSTYAQAINSELQALQGHAQHLKRAERGNPYTPGSADQIDFDRKTDSAKAEFENWKADPNQFVSLTNQQIHGVASRIAPKIDKGANRTWRLGLLAAAAVGLDYATGGHYTKGAFDFVKSVIPSYEGLTEGLSSAYNSSVEYLKNFELKEAFIDARNLSGDAFDSLVATARPYLGDDLASAKIAVGTALGVGAMGAGMYANKRIGRPAGLAATVALGTIFGMAANMSETNATFENHALAKPIVALGEIFTRDNNGPAF